MFKCALCPLCNNIAWQVSVTASIFSKREVLWWSQLQGAAVCPGVAAGRERLDPAGIAGVSSGVRLGLRTGCETRAKAAMFSSARGQDCPSALPACVWLCVPICSCSIQWSPSLQNNTRHGQCRWKQKVTSQGRTGSDLKTGRCCHIAQSKVCLCMHIKCLEIKFGCCQWQ